MCKVDIKIKNEKVVLSTRISKGFDENGKRIRERFHLEVSEKDYPTKESQLKAFNDYLIGVGESSIEKTEEKEDVIQTKKNDELSEEISVEHIEVNQVHEISTRHISKIPLSKIRLNEFNPYTIDDEFIQRLAYAIKEDGLNNPIHVVLKNNEYVVNKGNKRFLAYQLLNEKYSNEYNEIECYIMETLNNNDLEILQLLRDNDNTYERTLLDKMKETELYHRIYPSLKEEKKIEKGLRENEWIANEMGLADKSIKDYLKVIKNDPIKEMFYNDKIDTLESALKLCDFYKKHGEKWFNRLLEYCEERFKSNEGKILSINLFGATWNVEREKTMLEQKEIIQEQERKREENKNNQLLIDNNNAAADEVEEQPQEEPTIINIDELEKCCLAITDIQNMNFEFDNPFDEYYSFDCEIEFNYIDDFTKQKIYFNLELYSNKFKLLVALVDSENLYVNYDRFNKIIDLEIENVKENEFYALKEYINIISMFTDDKIKLEITDKKNFVYDLLPKVLKERLLKKEE